MKKSLWFKNKNLKCVVLAAGKGSRLLTLTKNSPKPMVRIKEKPILDHIINYWKEYTDDFIFVVNYKKQKIIDYIKNYRDIKCQFVIQKELKGIADALLAVEKKVGNKFIVVLGDCICKGNFNFPAEMEQGVGIWEASEVNDIKNSYAVQISSDLVKKVKEKPKRVSNNLCGLGFYFFDKIIFDYIKKTPPSELRGEIELTDVIQKMVKSKEKIHPVLFEGDYININTEKELNRAKNIISI